MRRQRRTHHYTEDDDYDPKTPSKTLYQPFINGAKETDDFLQMERLPKSAATQRHRFENTIEAKVEPDDTLQALALRFYCTVADIKRLNKIDKDNEIHARKVVKIPVTVHSVLLQTLPAVHTSGNNSPKHSPHNESTSSEITTLRNPLEDSRTTLSEKLMVASVNAAGTDAANSNLNNINLNSKAARFSTIYTNEDLPRSSTAGDLNASSPLLDGFFDDEPIQLRPIRGPSLRTLDWSGSDCDMTWVCLFVVILALCFVIPLIYVIYVAEHTHHNNTTPH